MGCPVLYPIGLTRGRRARKVRTLIVGCHQFGRCCPSSTSHADSPSGQLEFRNADGDGEITCGNLDPRVLIVQLCA